MELADLHVGAPRIDECDRGDSEAFISRVASPARWLRQVAAIWASAALIARPERSRSATMSA